MIFIPISMIKFLEANERESEYLHLRGKKIV